MAGHHRRSVKTQTSVFPLNRPQLCTASLMMHQSDQQQLLTYQLTNYTLHIVLCIAATTFSHANYVPLLPSDSTDS
ncbi:hypothetical protein T10_6016 [Trichinella papuae]|uniref:Uncharacterized protein n=1 Tax=Trichinella papuae TaxID=268474 RepID=A0A0V1N795_9BILA|nr:hypothetical protein T10_6016 [Trichinella papuae]